MEPPKFKIGQTIYCIYDWQINQLIVSRIEGDASGWTFRGEGNYVNDVASDHNGFATKAEAKKALATMIDEDVERHRQELIKKGK